MFNTSLCCEVAVLGRTSAPYGRPTALPHSRLRSNGATPTLRGVAAAVLAVAALITAANAVPARAADALPTRPAALHDRHATYAERAAYTRHAAYAQHAAYAERAAYVRHAQH
ncbi:hypothetical protein [Streptomyces sp. NPDC020362]|uniref:hypothetical protein n=1 Tax=unclassified Streptomyces TaxID=2593676 RepID=UPI0033FC27C2